MLIMHLFVSYAHVNLYHFFSSSGVGVWLRLLLVALPGLFCLPFFLVVRESNKIPYIQINLSALKDHF